MVRITAIKVNTQFFKALFALTIFVCIVLTINLIFYPVINWAVSNTNIRIFEGTIKSTIISNDYSENSENVDMAVLMGKGLEYVLGFSLTKPQSIFGYQIGTVKNYEQMLYLSKISQNQSDIDENDKIIVPDNSKDSSAPDSEPEITPKQTVSKAKGVTLINETNYNIDLNTIASQKINISGQGVKPTVLIYHTHTCESYTSSQKYKYVPTDNDRTNDLNYSVVRVGEELASILKNQYKINVIQDKTIHDGDSYNRAYTKSLKTVQGYISKYPSISLIIDLHRDAADLGGKKLRVAEDIAGKPAAQVMTVLGSDGRGLPHPNWRQNLSLGVMFAKKLNEFYPGLSRGVDLKLGRFNQYVSTKSILIEVGANGNTMDEALNSTKYIAEVIAEILK